MKIPDFKFEKACLGDMIYRNSLKISNAISKNNYTIYTLPEKFPIIHVLSNGNIFAQNSQNMILLDCDWKEIKSIKIQRSIALANHNLVTNNGNKIYISDPTSTDVMEVDFDLSSIQILPLPKDIFHRECIHGLDYKNNHLNIFMPLKGESKDLPHFKISSFTLANGMSANYIFSNTSAKMKVSDETIFFSNSMNVFCYNAEDLACENIYHHPTGKISEIDNYYYEISANLTLFCYNSSGTIINKLDVKEILSVFNDIENIYLDRIKDYLYILTKTSKCMKFQLQ